MTLASLSAFAQEPIKWSFSANKVSEKVYSVNFTAIMDKGWYMYSQFNPAMDGPTPLTFKFVNNPDVTIDKDKLKEDGVIEEKFDSAFGMELKFYRNKVNFIKEIVLIGATKTNIRGTITFMGCNEEMCLPPQKVEFNIKVK